MSSEAIEVSGALALRKSDWTDDWYVIERAEHDGREWDEPIPGQENAFALMTSARISDADVEGTASEMRALAAAIERRGCDSFRRCAVRVVGDLAFFRSPRNSRREASVPLAVADALARAIRASAAEVAP